jgi:SulP family sulfate permease
VRVAYLTGSLFFAATSNFSEAFARLERVHVLILSMRGVPMIDISGLEALAALHERMRRGGGVLLLAGVHEPVLRMLERGSLTGAIGADNIFWGSDQAILAAEERHTCPFCAAAPAPPAD